MAEGREAAGKIMLDTLQMPSPARIEIGCGELVFQGGASLEGTQITIGENGLFRACSFAELSGCGLEVLAGGEMFIEKVSCFHMDEATKVTNYGLFAVDGWEWEKKRMMAEIENHGTFYLSGKEELGGKFTNYGNVLLDGESVVTGCFENQGSVSGNNGHGRLKTAQGGEITGLQ